MANSIFQHLLEMLVMGIFSIRGLEELGNVDGMKVNRDFELNIYIIYQLYTYISDRKTVLTLHWLLYTHVYITRYA